MLTGVGIPGRRLIQLSINVIEVDVIGLARLNIYRCLSDRDRPLATCKPADLLHVSRFFTRSTSSHRVQPERADSNTRGRILGLTARWRLQQLYNYHTD